LLKNQQTSLFDHPAAEHIPSISPAGDPRHAAAHRPVPLLRRRRLRAPGPRAPQGGRHGNRRMLSVSCRCTHCTRRVAHRPDSIHAAPEAKENACPGCRPGEPARRAATTGSCASCKGVRRGQWGRESRATTSSSEHDEDEGRVGGHEEAVEARHTGGGRRWRGRRRLGRGCRAGEGGRRGGGGGRVLAGQ